MTRREWEIMYMGVTGDIIFLDDIPDERRLAHIEKRIGYALEAIEQQIARIRNLRELRDTYVPSEKE